MRQLAVLAVVLSLGSGCLRPPSKRTGYVANGAALAGGAAFLAVGLLRDCDDKTLGDSIGCSTSSGLSTGMGIALLGLGTLGMVITAASDVPRE